MNRQKQIFGKQIQHYRTLWGLSQAQLADALQTSADYISDLEGERKPLSFHLAWKFCTFFGISLDELYFGNTSDELPALVKESAETYTSSPKDTIWKLLETCSEEECAICEEILKHTLETLRREKEIPEQISEIDKDV